MFWKYRVGCYLLLVLYLIMLVATVVAAFSAQPAGMLIALAAGTVVSLYALLWLLNRYNRAVTMKLAEDLKTLLAQLEEEEKMKQAKGGNQSP